jgi:HSP20 family molecular chaperone IbpA
MVTVDDDYDEFFGVSDFFDTKFLRRLQSHLERMMEDVRNGNLKGTWKVKRFDEPSLKGFYIQGSFGSDEALEPLEPLRPTKRRPLPENPFEVPSRAEDKVREPLTDIFDEGDVLRVYVELPGAEKDNVRLTVEDDSLEIRADHLYKIIRLPKAHVDAGSLSSEYKNGMLTITIPKRKELHRPDTGNVRMV